MMRQPTLLFATIVPTLLITATSYSQPESTVEHWATVQSPDRSFSVRMPSGWQEDSTSVPNVLSLRPKRPDTVSPDQFVNCKAQADRNPATAQLTQEALDRAVAAGPAPQNVVQDILSAVGSDATLRHNGTMHIAEHPAYFMVIAATKTGIHVVAAQSLLVRPGWSYSIACTVGARTADQADAAWTQWKPTLMRIIGGMERS